MFKKLFILVMLITSLFGGIRELTDENFGRATSRGLVVVEFWATWNEAKKVTILDEWDTFDAKVYRVTSKHFLIYKQTIMWLYFQLLSSLMRVRKLKDFKVI